MQVSQIINQKTQLSTGEKDLKPTDNCTVEEADQLFEMLPHLVNQQFKAWYCKQFYKYPRAKVMELAALAVADGRNPQRLFSFLLKGNNGNR